MTDSTCSTGQRARLRQSLLAALYDHLASQLRNNPCLENASAAFASSPATFKRWTGLTPSVLRSRLLAER